VLALLFLGFNNTRYAGLGLDVIAQSFNGPLPWYDFLLKTMATAWTLGSGFKGGEVTPLFFIGATLGSALSAVLALPTDLLAAMGLVAVFAAASNTPVTCLLLGIELFGAAHAPFIAIGSFVAYLFSGHRSIYSAQLIGAPKHYSMADDLGRPAGEMRMKAPKEGER
jgi:H+/Cl- antiporter ClcA